jgi:hypothetical protein
MKMARSRTQKKYAKRPKSPIPREQTAAAADYIKDWTTRELGRLQKDNSPVCVPIKNGYMIGLHRVKLNVNKTCDLLDHNQEFVHRFENKISAILYAIYITKKRYYQADEILACDQVINKCYTDMLFLRNTIEQAKQRKDYVTVDIRAPRLEIAETRLNLARDRMSKIHNTAKYYKIWE